MPRGHTRETLISCRRRPGGERCTGLLWVVKQDDDALHAFCPTCRADEFLIHNWEDTLWAEGPMESMPVEVVFDTGGDPAKEQGTSGADEAVIVFDEGDPLARVLARMESRLSASTVRDRIPNADSPMVVVDEILESLPRPPAKRDVEMLLPILMDLWNATSRPDLGGRPPTHFHRRAQPARAEPKVGRNAPCPCGSGKKYKRCCGVN